MPDVGRAHTLRRNQRLAVNVARWGVVIERRSLLEHYARLLGEELGIEVVSVAERGVDPLTVAELADPVAYLRSVVRDHLSEEADR
jgi:hypothetical protein